MLLALLKNVSNWAYKVFLDNNFADKEAELHFGSKDDSNKG
jgi:hypothetical protein